MKSSICINIDDTTTVAMSPTAGCVGGGGGGGDRDPTCPSALAMDGAGPATDQLRALSLNRLDGVLRSTGAAVPPDLPFKCPSYPRLGERQLSSSTALDEFSLSPRLGSNANLSQDLDASDLLPVVESASEVVSRTSGVALTRSVSVRNATTRPLIINVHSVAPSIATASRSSSRRPIELTSEQRLPFPECPATVGGIIRRSTSCPVRMMYEADGSEPVLATINDRMRRCERSAGAGDGDMLNTEPGEPRSRRRRSSAFERDVDLQGEVVADLPVAVRAQFPDFEPEPLVSLGSDQRRSLAPTTTAVLALPTSRVSQCVATTRVSVPQLYVDPCLLFPANSTPHHLNSGCLTPPVSRCDIQIKCLRWLRETERQEKK